MIEIITELDVEVTKPNIFQAVVAKQYDMNTRFLKVTLKDSGTRIGIPNIESVKVVINAERKDGQAKGFDGVVNEDNTVTVPLHSWMLELEGTVICDISVIDTAEGNNKKLTTTSFTLIVEKAAYGGDDVTSDSQYDVLVSLLADCENASKSAEEALEKSNEALINSNEANAKYEACVEATNNANAVREEIEAGGYIESLKELNQGGKFSFWVGTQAEYDALAEKQPFTLYIITDEITEFELPKLIEEFNAFVKSTNTQIETLKNAPGKAVLVYDYTKGESLAEGDTVTPLTNQKFPIYYITILNTSSSMIAGGVYWTDGTQYGWAIRGSGGNCTAGHIYEDFISLTHIGDNLTLNNFVNRTQNILTKEIAFNSGQSIARIYGIGQL